LDEPPDIRYGEDSCDRCLMIINEARFAAAYVTEAGQTRRFDDIGGMVAYTDEISEDGAVFWVHDFDTEEWLKAEEAFYVESQQQTPMGFGIIAFADQQRAEQWAMENDGVILSFSDLFG
jgi:copper chaperone NosL